MSETLYNFGTWHEDDDGKPYTAVAVPSAPIGDAQWMTVSSSNAFFLPAGWTLMCSTDTIAGDSLCLFRKLATQAESRRTVTISGHHLVIAWKACP
jgi:hypothetical protein